MGISGGVTHRTEQQPRGGQPGDLHGPVAAFPLPSRKPERKPQRCPNPGPSAPSVPSGEIRIQPKAARRDFCLLFPFSCEKDQRRNRSVLPLHHPPPPAACSSSRPGAPNPKTHQNHEKRAREAEMTELQVLERAVSWQCPGVPSKSRWAPLVTQLTRSPPPGAASCTPHFPEIPRSRHLKAGTLLKMLLLLTDK